MTRGAFLALIAAMWTPASGPVARPAALAGGPFMGRPASGAAATLFAPGLVSTGLEEAVVAFTPDGRECYWSVVFAGLETILTSRLTDEGWTQPEVAPFAGRYFDGWPAIQPDGSRLFFHSSRPIEGSGAAPASFNIWVMDRTAGGWGTPRPLGAPVNGAENATCPSVTRDGTIYFSKRFADGTEKICRARRLNGAYGELEALPAAVNGMKQNFHGVISPDEAMLVRPYHGRPDALGGGWNYYVSFRSADDRWSELVNAGAEINRLRCGGASAFSPDGRYLFFQASAVEETFDLQRRHSLRELMERENRIGSSDIYWIDARTLDVLRPAQTSQVATPANRP